MGVRPCYFDTELTAAALERRCTERVYPLGYLGHQPRGAHANLPTLRILPQPLDIQHRRDVLKAAREHNQPIRAVLAGRRPSPTCDHRGHDWVEGKGVLGRRREGACKMEAHQEGQQSVSQCSSYDPT